MEKGEEIFDMDTFPEVAGTEVVVATAAGEGHDDLQGQQVEASEVKVEEMPVDETATTVVVVATNSAAAAEPEITDKDAEITTKEEDIIANEEEIALKDADEEHTSTVEQTKQVVLVGIKRAKTEQQDEEEEDPDFVPTGVGIRKRRKKGAPAESPRRGGRKRAVPLKFKDSVGGPKRLKRKAAAVIAEAVEASVPPKKAKRPVGCPKKPKPELSTFMSFKSGSCIKFKEEKDSEGQQHQNSIHSIRALLQSLYSDEANKNLLIITEDKQVVKCHAALFSMISGYAAKLMKSGDLQKDGGYVTVSLPGVDSFRLQEFVKRVYCIMDSVEGNTKSEEEAEASFMDFKDLFSLFQIGNYKRQPKTASISTNAFANDTCDEGDDLDDYDDDHDAFLDAELDDDEDFLPLARKAKSNRDKKFVYSTRKAKSKYVKEKPANRPIILVREEAAFKSKEFDDDPIESVPERKKSKKSRKKKKGDEEATSKFHLCSLCGQVLKFAIKLEYHMNWHNGLTPFECESCDFKSHSQHQVWSHVRTQHKEVIVAKKAVDPEEKCPLCPERNSEKHMQLHHKETLPYVCKECPFRGLSEFRIRVHAFKYHGANHPYTDKVQCDKCPAYINAGHMPAHLRKYHDENLPFGCDECGFRAITQNQIKQHKGKVHSKREKFPCQNNCGQSFTDKGYMLWHARRHCNLSTEKEALKQAERYNGELDKARRHDKKRVEKFEKLYALPIETAAEMKEEVKNYFKKAREEVSHTKMNEVGKYQCPSCPTVSTSLCALTQHTALHHDPALPFGCDHCEYRGITEGAILQHNRLHHMEKKVRCEAGCGKMFSSVKSMKAHAKRYCSTLPDSVKAEMFKQEVESGKIAKLNKRSLDRQNRVLDCLRGDSRIRRPRNKTSMMMTSTSETENTEVAQAVNHLLNEK